MEYSKVDLYKQLHTRSSEDEKLMEMYRSMTPDEKCEFYLSALSIIERPIALPKEPKKKIK